MQIGDEVITRESMPAMQAWQMNPDHLRQGIQDVLNMKLNQPIVQPQAIPQQGQMEQGNTQWG